VPIFRSWRLSGIFATCVVVPWLCRRSDLVGWLCVHWGVRSTLYLFLLYKLINMFRATLCPSSGADGLVVFFHVWCSAVASATYSPMDTQPANRIWPPTQPRHYTEREKIPLSCQLLKMGTRWPETCWLTYKGEINTTCYVLPNRHTTSQPDLTAYTATALHHTWQKYN